jgi:hypothetical protein
LKQFLLILAACGGGAQTGPDAAAITDTTAPAAVPDLRFKWVGAFPAYTSPRSTNVAFLAGGGPMTQTLDGQDAWSPFELGGGDSWQMSDFTAGVPVDHLTSIAQAGPLADAPGVLAGFPVGDVITALDYTTDAYAVIADTAVPPDGKLVTTLGGVAAAAALSGYVSTQAGNHAVVTALGFDGTTINVASYAEQNDTAIYQTSVAVATTTSLTAQAQTLAAGGYTITAIGRTSATNYALVGTRIAGTATPREVKVVAVPDPMDDFAQGFVVVGMYFDGADHAILER